MTNLIPNNNNPSIQQLKPKPIFVIKLDRRYDPTDRRRMCEEIYKSEMAKEYHVMVMENDKDTDEFEMFNADKIERQEWNTLVNKILK